MMESKVNINNFDIINFNEYIQSDKYAIGLKSAQTIWSQPNVFRLSSLYVYLNLISVPTLMCIEIANSVRMKSPEGVIKDLMHTRFFLKNLVGLADHKHLQGGIKNDLVNRNISQIAVMHRKFHQMQEWMMVYVAYIITMAPIRIFKNISFSEDLYFNYYKYMQYAWSIMNVEITSFTDEIKLDNKVKLDEVVGSVPELFNYVNNFRAAYEIMFGVDETCWLWKRVLASLSPSVLKLFISYQI
ncbi:MAG: hypothetical protein F6K36_22085 [Symploca sp. SIO3C6]|nr:hypothetical protein [Symploca sp. SIO3C6]